MMAPPNPTTNATSIVPNTLEDSCGSNSNSSITSFVVLPEKNSSSSSATLTITDYDDDDILVVSDEHNNSNNINGNDTMIVNEAKNNQQQQQPNTNSDTNSSSTATQQQQQDSMMDGLETKFNKALRLEAEVQSRVPTETETQELTADELDSLFAHDMYSLSLEERSKVLNDMHGVPDLCHEETTEFLTNQQGQFQTKILDIINNHNSSQHKYKHIHIDAYQQAYKQNSRYVTSSKLQLQFLRCENYNIQNAVYRMMEFFHLKLELFGPKLLTSDITLKDLSKDDKKSVESGFFQLLSVRDSAGRAIMMGIPCLRNYKNTINFKRGFYYMVMTAMHDVSTQKNGITFIGYNMGKNRVVDRTAAWVVSQMRKILPMRIVGMHYCYDDFTMRPMMTVAMLVMGATNRVRFRGHYGTMQENFFKLQTFGMPTQALPITADGEPKNKAHRQWLKGRAKQEIDADDTSTAVGCNSDQFIVVPNRLDVLFGRGKPIQEHFGNIRYHALLDYYQDAYERARKFEKMQISKRVVDTVHAFGGQFLKQEGSGWVAVDDISARDKVSHAFRTRRSSSSTTTTTAASSTSTDAPPDRNVAGKRLFKKTITPPSTTTAAIDHVVVAANPFLCGGGGGDSTNVGGNQNQINLSSSLVVSDTDNDNEGAGQLQHHDDSDDSSHGDDAGGGKRARLWQSTFHEIGTES